MLNIKILRYYIFIVPFLFLGCNDNYIINIYDQEKLNKPIKCLKLKVEPASELISKNMNNLYDFNENCKNTLKIRYKSDIVCTSPYNTKKKNYNFPTSFVELSIIIDKKTIYSCYKDLTTEDLNDEIEKSYYKIKDDLNL